MKKRKEDISFDPVEYAYMDNMPLEGWVWEFMRRSEEYKSRYDLRRKRAEGSESQKWLIQEKDKLNQAFALEPYCCEDYNEKWSPTNKFIYSRASKIRPIRTFNLKYGSNLKLDKEVLQCKGDVFNQPLGAVLFHSTQSHPENIVMALIDISSPQSIDELLEVLKKDLLLWRNVLKLSIRSPKKIKKGSSLLLKKAPIWKSYLVVFDLVNSGVTPANASDILSKYDIFYSDVKNIENHYKRAEALINEGYRKYM